MARDLVIYGLKGSPFVRKVQVVLAEKGVEYDFEVASPFPAPDWFVAMNPARRIPVLRDRRVGSEGAAGTLPDSSAICAYIERLHPSPALYPADPFAFGRALWFEEYADTEFASRVGLGLFRPVVMARLMRREPDLETARETIREKLPPVFDYMERSLDGRPYLVGDTFGIADVAVATQLVNFHHAGARLDASRWPALAAFAERVLSRPSFAACVAEETALLPSGGVDL